MTCLKKSGNTTQLFVHKKPFLILGGELGNSSASSLAYMDSLWQKIEVLNLNTVLIPVYWELVEDPEGQFDFTLVNNMIEQARFRNLHLVFLWFGSWKNSMSCYVPQWVKTDQRRFLRARKENGQAMEMLTAFHTTNRDSDARAFRNFMKHLRHFDEKEQTVIMIQVENEVGMLEQARDYCNEAEKAFKQPVPQTLISYIRENRDSLESEFKKIWENNGSKTSGTWEEVFGKSLAADELFTAWQYAIYVDQIAKAGKEEYPLPMFVNAALSRPGHNPGEYPSGGPLPHLMDIWKAGGPHIDFLSPDIYFPDFTEWCGKYKRPGNPLFIPEVHHGPESAAQLFYAIGEHDALGFSPFSIESIKDPGTSPLAKSYHILTQLTPIILKNRGKGTMRGVLLDMNNACREICLGNYILTFSHDHTFRWSGYYGSSEFPPVGGLVILLGTDEFIIAGTGIIVTFAPMEKDKQAGILSIEEGNFLHKEWIPGRRMNGDQSHQGRHLHINYQEYGIQLIKLYCYS